MKKTIQKNIFLKTVEEEWVVKDYVNFVINFENSSHLSQQFTPSLLYHLLIL